MKISFWYKNGSLDAFRQFCVQNQNKTISLKLISESEPVKGVLFGHRVAYLKAAGLCLLLTDRATHPAYYGLDSIEAIHAGLPT
jgi:hypothetical protein